MKSFSVQCEHTLNQEPSNRLLSQPVAFFDVLVAVAVESQAHAVDSPYMLSVKYTARPDLSLDLVFSSTQTCMSTARSVSYLRDWEPDGYHIITACMKSVK